MILDHEKTAKGTKVYFSVYHATNQKLKEYYRLVKEAAKAAGVKKEELCARIEELSKSTKQMRKNWLRSKRADRCKGAGIVAEGSGSDRL